MLISEYDAKLYAQYAAPFRNIAADTNQLLTKATATDTLPAAVKRKRLLALNSAAAVSYSGMMLALNEAWYSQYARSALHFYNDNGEWNQVDKIGHTWTAYSEALTLMHLYQWAGMSRRKAAFWGASLAWLFQGSIEVLDGFSEKWGASGGDIIANTSGSLLMWAQETAWQEQRFHLKFSSHRVNYSHFSGQVAERARDLYGNTAAELVLKDYNGQTYWLTFHPLRVAAPQTTLLPKWLNIAIGYGAENMLGGYANEWKDANGEIITRYDIPRLRQYYLSVDVDLSKIKTRSKWLRTFLYAANMIKIPAPALEINSQGKFTFHPLYF
ncbi:MAG: DUF2279 domain-containing protein [Sphingobacteriales bacterium]|nr:DUF2279 domain-containing protein [Sphingobacteriales bacterium]